MNCSFRVPSLRRRVQEGIMKLLRTTALTAVLITAAVPILTSSAEAWRGGGWRGGGWRGAGIGWRGGGWGWRGAGVGLAAAAVAGSALAASSYYGYGYGYPAYGYGTGYSYPGYGYGAGIVRRGLYAAAAWRGWR